MKTVMIYATKYGSVRKAAELLREKLNGGPALVDVANEPAPSLDGYDTVILGGSVYMGRVQKKLSAYIQNNLDILLKKKLGIFLCATVTDSGQQEKELKDAYPSGLYDHALAKGILGYRFDFDKMHFLDKLIISKMLGNTKSVSTFYDEGIARFAQAMNAD